MRMNQRVDSQMRPNTVFEVRDCRRKFEANIKISKESTL
jgi:hypothetical protein